MNNFFLLATINIAVFVLYFSIKTIWDTRNGKLSLLQPADNKQIKVQDPGDQAKPAEATSKSNFGELMKWLIGTVGLGVAGIVINRQIQTTELDIKRIEADSKILEVVTKNVAENASSDSLEFHYLTFVRTFITTDSIKRAVEERRKELALAMKTKGENKAKDASKNQEKKAVQEITDGQKLELKKAEATFRNSSKEVNINDLKKEESKIAQNIAPIDSSAIATLNAVQQTITPSVLMHKEARYSLVADPVTKWCKEGYFVEFNNTLRIGINNLSAANKTINVNFKDIEMNADNPPLIKDDVSLSAGESLTQERNNYRYLITLNYIGAAGRNPFTKAAYITVATYKKD